MWANVDPHWVLGLIVVVICLALGALGHNGNTNSVMTTMLGWLIGRGSNRRRK